VLLDAEAVSTFTLNSGAWRRDQQLQITRAHVFPRDLRGLLAPAKDHLADVYLPGMVCNVAAGSSNAIACHEGDDPWPLGSKTALFNSGRNYFTGAIFPALNKTGGPFYSLAMLNNSVMVFSGIDGRVHINNGVTDRVPMVSVTTDWGSDITALKTSCGNGAQLLVTASGDDTASDSLRAFEIPGRDPVQVSASLDFPGPITALWTHGDHGDMATAVVHNLQTGSYEAYSVSITCNQ
jgi:hypothetical protein